MTEADWLACADPRRMLSHVESTASDRKLRLFECACCRRVWHLVNDERLWSVVVGLENFADGHISAGELEPLHELAWEIEEDDNTPPPSRHLAYELGLLSRVLQPGENPMYRGPLYSYSGRGSAKVAARGGQTAEERGRRMDAERGQQAILLRCIFGNPFRPVAFDPRWRSETAVALAAGIYAERAFDRLPILADALEEAGCDQPDVLTHCREPNGLHARGCWVVDGVLGKS